MVESLESRWESDFEVMKTAARLLEEQPDGLPVRCGAIAEALDRPVDEVFKSLRRLSETYLIISDAGARKYAGISMRSLSVIGVTDAGWVATGVWPAEEDALAELLQRIATALESTPGGELAASGIRNWLSNATSGTAAGVAASVALALPALLGRIMG